MQSDAVREGLGELRCCLWLAEHQRPAPAPDVALDRIEAVERLPLAISMALDVEARGLHQGDAARHIPEVRRLEPRNPQQSSGDKGAFDRRGAQELVLINKTASEIVCNLPVGITAGLRLTLHAPAIDAKDGIEITESNGAFRSTAIAPPYCANVYAMHGMKGSRS